METEKTHCSCGCTAPHIVGTRGTSDGAKISLWSDGGVTTGMGFGLRGVGVAHSESERIADVEAGWLALALVELYDLREVGDLVMASRKAVRQQMDDPRVAVRHYLRGDRIVKTGKATFEWRSTPNVDLRVK